MHLSPWYWSLALRLLWIDVSTSSFFSVIPSPAAAAAAPSRFPSAHKHTSKLWLCGKADHSRWRLLQFSISYSAEVQSKTCVCRLHLEALTTFVYALKLWLPLRQSQRAASCYHTTHAPFWVDSFASHQRFYLSFTERGISQFKTLRQINSHSTSCKYLNNLFCTSTSSETRKSHIHVKLFCVNKEKNRVTLIRI